MRLKEWTKNELKIDYEKGSMYFYSASNSDKELILRP